MGIQDRDYYWENYWKKQKNNYNSNYHQSVNRKSSNVRYLKSKKTSNIKHLLYPVITIGFIWYAVHVHLKNRVTRISVSPVNLTQPQQISGGVILKKDRQGHFRGTVLVNNIPMPFLIDTGATRTAIPVKMAIKAKLPVGRTIQTSTAGGRVLSHETRINNLKIGSAIIRNLAANINDHLDEVLIGMNTLKYFSTR